MHTIYIEIDRRRRKKNQKYQNKYGIDTCVMEEKGKRENNGNVNNRRKRSKKMYAY